MKNASAEQDVTTNSCYTCMAFSVHTSVLKNALLLTDGSLNFDSRRNIVRLLHKWEFIPENWSEFIFDNYYQSSFRTITIAFMNDQLIAIQISRFTFKNYVSYVELIGFFFLLSSLFNYFFFFTSIRIANHTVALVIPISSIDRSESLLIDAVTNKKKRVLVRFANYVFIQLFNLRW